MFLYILSSGEAWANNNLLKNTKYVDSTYLIKKLPKLRRKSERGEPGPFMKKWLKEEYRLPVL